MVFKLLAPFQEWELDDVPKGPFFDDDTINNLQNIAEEVEKNRLKKNIGVIGGSSTSIVGGVMSIIGGSLLLTPITVVAGAALLGIGIGLGVAGSSVTLGFSLDKTVRDKLRKDEIKDCLNEFVNIQSNVVSSVANIFETMDAIKGFKDIDKAKFTEVERVMLKKLQKMITEHEAGWNVDFITLPEILKKLHCQSKKLVEYLKHIEAMTGTQLLEMKKTALQTTCSHKNSLSSYRAQENAVETFVGFARRYLKLDDIDLQDTSAAGAKEGLQAGNASFSTAGMATKIAFPANDVAALGGNALKIANGFTAAGIVLGAVGLVVDAGFLGYAIYDLLKSDNEKFTQGLLEVIDLMEQMNRIDMRSKNEN